MVVALVLVREMLTPRITRASHPPRRAQTNMPQPRVQDGVRPLESPKSVDAILIVPSPMDEAILVEPPVIDEAIVVQPKVEGVPASGSLPDQP
jgi:hypothetical protein